MDKKQNTLFEDKELSAVLDAVSGNEDLAERVESSFEILERNINIRMSKKMYVPSNRASCLMGDFDYIKAASLAKREYENYVEGFTERAGMYLTLKQMYEDKQEELRGVYERRVHYRKYGKSIAMFGGFYCPSAIEDLVVSNVNKGKLYKNAPLSLTGKVEYDYDKNGQLIMSKWYKDNKKVRAIEFFIYCTKSVIRVYYNCGAEKDNLADIVWQVYENELLTSCERVEFEMEGNIIETYVEKYKYSENILKECWRENYQFDIEDEPLFLPKEQYLFEADDDGKISSYCYKQWWGDMERNDSGEHVWQFISEKKRMSTEKKAGRWRRPNYFIE